MLPAVVSLVSHAPNVYDQGSLGSCVAQAVAKAIEIRLHYQGLRRYIPSRLALYYGARQSIGTTGEDSGAIIADCLSHVRNIGFADESYWDYAENLGQFAAHPPWNYYDAASEARVVNMEALDHDAGTIHWELASGHPVLAGMVIDEGFDNAVDGVITPGGARLGGHAVAIVGIDMANRRVLVMNSWGTLWGDNGLAWLPLDVLLDPVVTGELHSLRVVRVRRDMPPVADRIVGD